MALRLGPTGAGQGRQNMGIYEFRGPGLSDAQWGQIKTLADSLDDKQLLWLSGFFAGVEFRAGNVEGSTPLGLSVPPLAPSLPERTLSVLYGSETGNSAELATSLAAQFNALIEGCFRVVNSLDVVPFLPPTPPTAYVHVGGQISINSGGQIQLGWRHSLAAYQQGLTGFIAAQR